ncbi:hypothetical protein OIU77_017305 [Salix suchowensis]|uniref:Uncharacterized protein n=1 Tax=Salix suchowensis TaxID=1278906 RepID=A0ABQ8ZNC3_9ROSI|nr:hypothetical protein OIU77_017305 [Salix suchowensis]
MSASVIGLWHVERKCFQLCLFYGKTMFLHEIKQPFSH